MVIVARTTVDIEDEDVEITVNNSSVEISVTLYNVEIEDFEVEDEDILPQYEADYTARDFADQMENYMTPKFLREVVKDLQERIESY